MFESLARRVKEKITHPNLPAVICAATEHLTSLVSSVTGSVNIWKVGGCDLVTILDSVKSKVLSFIGLSLGSEETQALVRAM